MDEYWLIIEHWEVIIFDHILVKLDDVWDKISQLADFRWNFEERRENNNLVANYVSLTNTFIVQGRTTCLTFRPRETKTAKQMTKRTTFLVSVRAWQPRVTRSQDRLAISESHHEQQPTSTCHYHTASCMEFVSTPISHRSKSRHNNMRSESL